MGAGCMRTEPNIKSGDGGQQPERDVSVASSTPGVTLAGTVCEPREGTIAAALLVSGSGPQDRDETVAGHAVFRVMAHELARVGVATLRVDDRGVGGSGGDYLASTPDQIVHDAALAWGTLRAECGRVPTGIIGHSQGCLIGALAAARTSPAFFVALSGTCERGRDALLGQHRDILESEGATPAAVVRQVSFMSGLFDIIEGTDDAGEQRRQLGRYAAENLELLRESGFVEEADEEIVAFVVDDASEWETRFLLTTDARGAFERVPCPVLAMCGENDLQVDAERSLGAIEDAVRGTGMPFRGRVLSGLNHLLQVCTRETSFAYDDLGPPDAGGAAQEVREWLDTGVLAR